MKKILSETPKIEHIRKCMKCNHCEKAAKYYVDEEVLTTFTLCEIGIKEDTFLDNWDNKEERGRKYFCEKCAEEEDLI